MARSESSLAELLLNVDNRIREGRSKRKDADALVGGVEGAKQGAMSESASELRSAVETAFAAAETEYLAAVKLLEPELRDRNRLATASPAGGASEDRKDLALRLADCYGSLGGIARRKNDYRGALEWYDKGREVEADPAYEITSTYNRVQSIVMQISVDQSSLSRAAGDLIGRTRSLLDLLSGILLPDAWTSADIILLAVISGNRRRLRRGWDALIDNEPTDDVYKSGLLVLKDLEGKLSDNALLSHAIGLYESKVSGRSSG